MTSASEKHLLIHTFFNNHASSLLDPKFICSYISSKQAAGCYSKAYAPDALESIISPFQMSPLGLVPKPLLNKLRLIQDISFPRNDRDLTSVNARVNSNDFPTSWGTFDSTAELILSLSLGCIAATFNICHSCKQRSVQKLGNKQNTQACILALSESWCLVACHVCFKS